MYSHVATGLSHKLATNYTNKLINLAVCCLSNTATTIKKCDLINVVNNVTTESEICKSLMFNQKDLQLASYIASLATCCKNLGK